MLIEISLGKNLNDVMVKYTIKPLVNYNAILARTLRTPHTVNNNVLLFAQNKLHII